MIHVTRKCSIAAESHIRSHYHISPLYPGPGFLSSATWPSLPKKHYNGLNQTKPKYNYFGKPSSIRPTSNIILYEVIISRVYGHNIKL